MSWMAMPWMMMLFTYWRVVPSATGDAHRHAAPIDGLVAGHQELIFETDGHAVREDDPQRPRLGDGVTQSSGCGVGGAVVVG